MTPVAKLDSIYIAARALQLACASDVIQGAGRQMQAHMAFVDSLASHLDKYLGPPSADTEFKIMRGVMKLGTL